jgi:nucleoside-diphosphate-sugar epimerase
MDVYTSNIERRPAMKQPKILVTGATGRTGSAVVDELLAKGVPARLIGLVWGHSASTGPDA